MQIDVSRLIADLESAGHSKTDICKIMSGVSGKRIANNYITRWLKGRISYKMLTLLRRVHGELVDTD